MESTSTNINEVKEDTSETISKEKLLEKCRRLLMIADKAKQAKNEALQTSTTLKTENAALMGKLENVEKQLKNSQEMLGALTEQKLMFAMELDETKKLKAQCLEDNRLLSKKCEKLEVESESYKRQYSKVINENDQLLEALKEAEELSKKEALQQQADIQKLMENNDNVKLLLRSVTTEKDEMVEQLNITNNKLTELLKEHNHWLSYLSNKFSLGTDSLEYFAESIDQKIGQGNSSINSEELNARINYLQNELEKISNQNTSIRTELETLEKSSNILIVEKDSIESELNELQKKNEELVMELNKANIEKERVATSLSELQAETRNLEETSENLLKNIDVLKTEKNEYEKQIAFLNENRNALIKELDDRINEVKCLNEKIKKQKNAMNSEIKCEEEIKTLQRKLEDKDKSVSDLTQKLLNAEEEIKILKSKNELLKEEVESFKLCMEKTSEKSASTSKSLLDIRKEKDLIKTEIMKIKTDIHELNSEITSDIQQAFQPLKEICAGMEKEKSAFNKELSSLRENEQLSLSEFKNLQEKLAECELELQRLKAIDKKSNELIEEKIKENELLNKKVLRAKEDLDLMASKTSASIEVLKKEKEEMFQKNTNLNEEIVSLKTMISEHEARFDNKMKENDQLSKQISEISNNTQAFVEKCQLDLELLRQEKSDFSNKSETLASELTSLKEKFNVRKLELEDKIKDNETLKSKLEEITRKAVESDKKKSLEIDSLKIEKDKLKSVLKDISKELSDLKEVLRRKEVHLGEQEEEMKVLKKSLLDVQDNSNDVVTALNEKVQNLSEEKKDLMKKIEVLQNELSIAVEKVSHCIREVEGNSKESEKNLRDLEKYKTENKELKNNCSVLNKKLIDSQNFVKQQTQELDNLKKLCATKDMENNKLKTNFQEQSAIINEQKQEIKILGDEITQGRVEAKKKIDLINLLQKEIDKLELEKNDLIQSVAKISAESDNLSQQLIDSVSQKKLEGDKDKQVNDSLTEELKSCRQMLEESNKKFEESNRVWHARLTAHKGCLIGLRQTYEDLVKNVADFQAHTTSEHPLVLEKIREKVEHFMTETVASSKHELLSEMQQMNQVLKERGEIISKLQESISEGELKQSKLIEENQELHKKLQLSKDNHVALEGQIKNKDSVIKDLEAEINKLREAHETSTDADGMSTSTISKCDEASRLKDVEESFEEKYAKLRSYAIKMKQKLLETTNTLEAERKKISAERQEHQEKTQNLASVAKNAQKVQESFDKLLDEFEDEKKKNQFLQTSLEKISKREEETRSKMEKYELEAEKVTLLKKQIESLDTMLKEARKETQNLLKEKKVEIMKYDELKKEHLILETKFSEAKLSLEQSIQQGRASNVLELEMQNYEKTIAEQAKSLSAEREAVKNLNNELTALKNLNNGLEEQIKLLEGRITVEEERNIYVNEQLGINRSKIEELQSQGEQHVKRIHDLTRELQSEKNKCESLVIECSTLGSEFKKRESDLHHQVDKLERHVQSLETNLSTKEQELSAYKNEIDYLRKEFESYRIRAQSVLAKQKGETVTQGEKEARERLDLITNELQTVKEQLDNALVELDALKSESLLNLSAKERNEKRLDELTKAIQKKTQECDNLSSEFRKYKISSETLVQCYKNEIEQKDMQYKKDITNYEHQIEELSSKLKNGFTASLNEKPSGEVPSRVSPPQMEGLPFEREDGEGSESVPSPSARRQSMLVPLDVLLNSPMDDETRATALEDELEKLKSELNSYEVRTRHLSSLLSEAEKDSARNSQLNSVLKEEVRRLERSLERHPHVANAEYLKNVVIKFLTLQSSDERQRLVPVLDTILKLSPQETQKLNAVARGETSSGWGHYLPSWSGM